MDTDIKRERLTFAVLGLGYWGPNLLRVLMDIDTVDVKWICDREPSRLATFSRRYPSVESTRDFDDILNDPQVDAVVIATPVFTHFDLAARSLDAGKHTFIEKPLAPSSDLARTLVEKAEDAGLILMCGHTFLYSPPVRKIKHMVDTNELGDIFFVTSSRVNLGLHQRDVSVIWDLGPHDFSILLYWLDEMPVSVRAIGRDSIVSGIPDVAFITLTFPSGIVANVELSWLAPSKLRRTVVVGSKKMVVYDDGAPEPVRLYDRGVIYEDPETFGEYHLSYRTGDILSPKLEAYEPLFMELTEFSGAIIQNASLHPQVEIAERVVRLTEAADESLRRGGREIRLETPRLFSRFDRAKSVANLAGIGQDQ